MRNIPAHGSGHEHRLRLIVESAGVAGADVARYLAFARSLERTLRRRPVPDFSRETKREVRKWFERGLSGNLLWKVGAAVLAARYEPDPPQW
jgi:hypothetical protein